MDSLYTHRSNTFSKKSEQIKQESALKQFTCLESQLIPGNKQLVIARPFSKGESQSRLGLKINYFNQNFIGKYFKIFYEEKIYFAWPLLSLTNNYLKLKEKWTAFLPTDIKEIFESTQSALEENLKITEDELFLHNLDYSSTLPLFTSDSLHISDKNSFTLKGPFGYGINLKLLTNYNNLIVAGDEGFAQLADFMELLQWVYV